MEAAVNGYGASSNHHDGREVERVKRNPGEDSAPVHDHQRKTEDVRTIAALALQLKMHPAEDEWKGNQCRDDAAPHDERVHQPACEAALEDEFLFDETVGECPGC